MNEWDILFDLINRLIWFGCKFTILRDERRIDIFYKLEYEQYPNKINLYIDDMNIECILFDIDGKIQASKTLIYNDSSRDTGIYIAGMFGAIIEIFEPFD